MISLKRTGLFSLKSTTFRLGQTNWADKFSGIWGIFTHFGTVSPLSMISIIQSLLVLISTWEHPLMMSNIKVSRRVQYSLQNWTL